MQQAYPQVLWDRSLLWRRNFQEALSTESSSAYHLQPFCPAAKPKKNLCKCWRRGQQNKARNVKKRILTDIVDLNMALVRCLGGATGNFDFSSKLRIRLWRGLSIQPNLTDISAAMACTEDRYQLRPYKSNENKNYWHFILKLTMPAATASPCSHSPYPRPVSIAY